MDQEKRFCPECGALVDKTLKFCPNCGQNLAADQVEPPVQPAATNDMKSTSNQQEPVTQNRKRSAEPTPSRHQPQRPKKSRKPWIAVIVVVVILVAGGAFIWSSSQKTTSTASDSGSQSSGYTASTSSKQHTNKAASSSESRSISSSSVSSSATSTTAYSAGVDQHNLTTAQVESLVWQHFQPTFAEDGYTREDYTMDMGKNSDGLLQITVRENHNSANMKADGADPDTAPVVATYEITSEGYLAQTSANGSISVESETYGE